MIGAGGSSVRSRTRRLLTAGCALTIAAAGCGGGAGGNTRVTAGLIARRAGEFQDGSARMHATLVRDFGSAHRLVFDGEYDGRQDGSVLRVTTVGGINPGVTETRTVAGVAYQRSAGADAPGVWYRLDESSLMARARAAMPDLTNPFGLMRFFADVARVETLGTDEIDGVAVTRCRLTLDMAAVTSRLPEDLRSVSDSAAEPPTYEVWVDGQGRVRRMRATIDGEQGTEHVEVDFSDFGADIRIGAPPADQVVDAGPIGAFGVPTGG